MLVAPGTTPRAILEKLNAEVNAIVHTEEIAGSLRLEPSRSARARSTSSTPS